VSPGLDPFLSGDDLGQAGGSWAWPGASSAEAGTALACPDPSPARADNPNEDGMSPEVARPKAIVLVPACFWVGPLFLVRRGLAAG